MRQTIDHPSDHRWSDGFAVSVRCQKMWISVAVTGELDLATVGFFEDSIEPYRSKQGLLLFDLGRVTFVDVVGFKPIVRACSSNGARIGVTSRSVRYLLRLLDGLQRADPWFVAPAG